MCNIIYVHFVLCCHMKQKGISRNSCAALIPFTHPSKEVIAVRRPSRVTSLGLQDFCVFLPTGKGTNNYSIWYTVFVHPRDRINPKLFDFQNQNPIVHFYLSYQSSNKPVSWEFYAIPSKLENSLESQTYFYVQVMCSFSLHE